MRLKQKIGLIFLLQLLGVASAFLFQEFLDPNFRENYAKVKEQGNETWMNIFVSRHIGFMAVGYLPFAFLSIPFVVSVLAKHYPQRLSIRGKKTLATATLVLAVFLVSSGVTYLYALGGMPVAKQDMVAFVNTPLAFLLIIVGAFGLLTLATLPKKSNPKWKKWLKLAVGFGMVLLAWIYLEFLLASSYQRNV